MEEVSPAYFDNFHYEAAKEIAESELEKNNMTVNCVIVGKILELVSSTDFLTDEDFRTKIQDVVERMKDGDLKSFYTEQKKIANLPGCADKNMWVQLAASRTRQGRAGANQVVPKMN